MVSKTFVGVPVPTRYLVTGTPIERVAESVDLKISLKNRQILMLQREF